jgi:AcrR family transcriptional regulator
MTTDARDTRERLLDAAEALFADRGYDAVTVRDIAAAAEVNVAAVNYHFHGKDRLYGEVLRRVIAAKRDRHLDAMETILADEGQDLADVIGDFFRTHLDDVLRREEGGNFLKLFVRELHHGSPEGAEMIRELLQPMWDGLGRAVIKHHPEVDPKLVPWIIGSLHGQLIHFTMRWRTTHGGDCHPTPPEAIRLLFPPLADDLDRYIERAVEHITRFSVAGIEAVAAGKTVEEHS